jgi:cobyrinic acid a,c-diamide synthase
MVKTLVIAGTQSGVGKTTLVVGLVAALRARGLTVQPFKVGPDYIDPSHHTLAAGRACRNLDTWMMPPARMAELFEKAARGADVAVIEGVMGLFDGVGYEDETGSTAQVAKLLHAPVVVVIDAAKMGRSAAALAAGFQRFDPDVTVAGFLINRIGSDRHGRGVAAAVSQATDLPVFGCVPRSEALHVPERHLGLVPSAEPGPWAEFITAAGALADKFIKLDRVLEAASDYHPPVSRQAASPVPACQEPVVIGVARDEAFHFCYPENLDLLCAAGATLEFFSPLHDATLPERSAGILLSGGFPEVFAAPLSANTRMHAALRAAHERGLPIYAECGGLMYLTEAIVDFDSRIFPMVGLLPGRSIMTKRLALGYRQARAVASSWLLQEGECVRGHEFHYSDWEGRPSALPAVYDLAPASGEGERRPEGACVGNLLASYVHLHFWGKPDLATRFVAACRQKSSEF